MRTLVLASASPARLRLLRDAGFDPLVVVSGVDESAVRHDDARVLADALAVAKAKTVAATVRQADALVIGCDSVLELDGQILGKPKDAAEAVERWQAMRGKSGTLVTGHCLVDKLGGTGVAAVAETRVLFAEVTDAEIEAYVATGEPLGVAGGFTIDGRGAPFVERIDGDHGNVVGLSLPLLRKMLIELDLSLVDLWR